LIAAIVLAVGLRSVSTELLALLFPDDSRELRGVFGFLWFPAQLPAFAMGVRLFHALRSGVRLPPRLTHVGLMLRHAMDDLKYRRMQWRCNALNAASRAAARRLGFRFEGISHPPQPKLIDEMGARPTSQASEFQRVFIPIDLLFNHATAARASVLARFRKRSKLGLYLVKEHRGPASRALLQVATADAGCRMDHAFAPTNERSKCGHWGGRPRVMRFAFCRQSFVKSRHGT
jgi:hypothetical protein